MSTKGFISSLLIIALIAMAVKSCTVQAAFRVARRDFCEVAK